MLTLVSEQFGLMAGVSSDKSVEDGCGGLQVPINPSVTSRPGTQCTVQGVAQREAQILR